LTAETFLRSASSTLAFLPGGASASTVVPVCIRDRGWATNDRQYWVRSRRWVGSPSTSLPMVPSGATRVTTASMVLGTITPGRAASSTVV
jgi:hypothetical protein